MRKIEFFLSGGRALCPGVRLACTLYKSVIARPCAVPCPPTGKSV